MIYGYAKKIVDEEYGLLQMREVTFGMSADQLRLVAQFLLRAADDIEGGIPFLHRHIQEVVKGWSSLGSEVDIVVMVPNQPIIDDTRNE